MTDHADEFFWAAIGIAGALALLFLARLVLKRRELSRRQRPMADAGVRSPDLSDSATPRPPPRD
jgi:hypothetical protein